MNQTGSRFVCLVNRVALLLLAAVLLFPAPARAEGAAETVTISFVGDCTVGEQYKYRGYESGYCYKITQAGLDYPFSLFAELFAQDDLTVANCEGCFTRRKPATDKAMSLCADPSFASVFRLGNVDVCNVINNHAKDFGYEGWLDTIAALEAEGIGYFGDEYVYRTELKGVQVGILGITYPILESKMNTYMARIAQLKEEGCGFVIASIHWGTEDSHAINQDQRAWGEKLIDAGADLVYGHGSHTLQPIEYYQGKLIFYSTSNFTFGANANPKDPDTAVFQVTFRLNGDGTMTASHLSVIPCRQNMNRDFRPYPVEEETEKQAIWAKLILPESARGPRSNLPDSFLTTGEAALTAAEP